MRTTIRINENLLKRAKKLAADEGRTLTSLVEDGLALILAKPKAKRREQVELPVSKAASGIFDKRDPPEADKSPLRSDKLRGIKAKFAEAHRVPTTWPTRGGERGVYYWISGRT
jgi:hypothetical protein